MKIIKSILIPVLVLVAAASIFGACQKDQTVGTLTVKIYNIQDKVEVNVYPYVPDYKNIGAIASAILQKSKSSESFVLNTGDYVVMTSLDQAFNVQVQSGKEATVTFTE